MPRSRASAAAVNVPTAAETVVVTLNGISSSNGNTVDIDANIFLTAGAAGGTYTVKVERGAVAGGAQVGASVLADFLAAGHVSVGIQASDQLAADVNGLQYCVTVTQTSGNTCVATSATVQQLF